jgi:DNA-packaging protein gp3
MAKSRRHMTPEELKAFDDRIASMKNSPKAWMRAMFAAREANPYAEPETLLAACAEYLDQCEEDPLQESKLVSFEGNSRLEEVPKMRVPTLMGLCLHLGIHRDTWGSWRRGDVRPELRSVVEQVEQHMWDKKFSGAAAGLLNPQIISRDLGLIDKQQIDGKTTVVIDGDEAKL